MPFNDRERAIPRRSLKRRRRPTFPFEGVAVAIECVDATVFGNAQLKIPFMKKAMTFQTHRDKMLDLRFSTVRP